MKRSSFVLIAICCAWSACVSALAQSPATAPAVEWLTLETPHFLITFQRGQETVAQAAAYYAELAHKKISQQLGYEPKDKTQLLLFDPTDDANGYAGHGNGYLQEGYFEVYAGPNSTLRSRIDTWLYTLAVHEHLHTIHLDMNAGWPSGVRGLFGRMGQPAYTPIPEPLWPDLTSPNDSLPMYLIEGFAAYMETINSDGGRLRDTYWEMLMRADFVNGQIITRDQAAERYPLARFTGDAPYYMYGAYFCDYLARTFGQDKLFDIMRENSKGTALFLNDTFIHVLGKPLPQVWDDFIAEAKATYTQQADASKAQGLTAMKRITHTGEYATSPVFSPDGSQIAYAQGGPRLTAAIRGVRIDGTLNHTVVTVDTVYSGESFSWSPDGTKLIYGRTDYVGLQSFADLYLFDLQTGQERRLTYGLRANGPTWSPDGQTIVFAAKRSPLQTSLMAMDADDSHLRELVAGKDEMQFSSPHFSPDGQRIAVEALAFGGYDDIYLLNADGSDLHALTQDRAKDFAPQWSPDGGYILFNSDRSGVNNIYAYLLSDGQLLQVTNVLYGAFSPTMSADGKTMAFAAYDSPTGFDVYTIGADPNSWKPVAFHREERPHPPNYAELAKGYAISPYSPFETLLPHFWQPILLLGELGASIQAEDALGQTSYGAAAEYRFGGPPEFSLSVNHTLTDLATNGLGGPAPPSVSVSLTPRTIRGSGFFPLKQSRRSSQVLNISATYGRLGTLQTEEGPIAVQGLKIDGEWRLELNGGRDSLRSSYALALNGSVRLADAGTRLGWGAKGTAVWQLSGDYLLQTEFQLDPVTLSGTGEVDLQFPVIHIEKELGTWPIYFDRILLSGSVRGDVTRQGMAISTYAVSVIFPTILWYRFEIDPQVGVVISADGQVQPSFSLGF